MYNYRIILKWSVFSFFVVVLLSGCAVGKVTERKSNGFFYASKRAHVLLSKPFDLDENKTLLLVPSGTFMKGMYEKIQ